MQHRHRAEHDQLRVMIDDYLDLLKADSRPDINEIMRRRLAFSNAYLGHIGSEGIAFGQLRTGLAGHPVDTALEEHGRQLREIMPGYSALIRDWTPARILEEWPGYCRQVRAQVARYHAFLAWEEAEVLPLLDRRRTALRA